MKVDHFGNFDYLQYIRFQYDPLFDTLGNKKTEWDIANKSYGYRLYKSLIPPCCYKCLKYNFGQTLFIFLSLIHLCQPLSDVHVADYVCRARSAVWLLIQHGVHYGFQAVTVVGWKRGSLSR